MTAADIAMTSISPASTKDSRRRQYRSCDRCRVGKRACNAEYESVAEAINNKVACSNCRKKGKLCSFQHVLTILGGVPSTAPQDGVASIQSAATLVVETKEDRGNVADEQCSASAALSEAKEDSQAYKPLTPSQSVSKRTTSSRQLYADSMMRSCATAAYHAMTNLSSTSSTSRMVRGIDSIFLNDGLIRIYEGAAEHALQCWITSSNTPYMLVNHFKSPSTSVGQQLVYWRICELDRGSRSLLGHTASGPLSRDKEIMDAFHSVVLAFAAQWTPRRMPNLADQPRNKTSEDRIRLALWERARDKLQKVADVDSFRVIFALIVFAWTEKPRQVHESGASGANVVLNGENYALDTSDWQTPAEGSTLLLVAAMRKLLAIKFRIEGRKRRGICPWEDVSGKPKIGHRAQSAASAQGDQDETMAEKIQSGLESKRCAPATASTTETSRMEGTYHMLYWLCVVIDTETSVLRKYPPVVCDEDSEIISCVRGADLPCDGPSADRKGIWDDYILDLSQRKHESQEFITSWPCDHSKAAATLAFSTPVKVVMFRQISRLQMSFWRRASTRAVEQHIRSGLSIIYHWNQIYGPLIDSCRASHAELPASIQSWYVLLAFPWYLATLLFVEMVQTVDMAGASDMGARLERARSGIFPKLRDRACADLTLLITAIQSTSFTHAEPTFQYVRDSGNNLLLTEPWSEILVHSIDAVLKTEIKLQEGYCSSFQWKELDESFQRIDKCLWALEQLSDRSPSAAMAHEQMVKLTNGRRQGSLQQIPMASPPMKRDVASQSIVVGLSPDSDGGSNATDLSFDSSTGGTDEFPLGSDNMQSALDAFFDVQCFSPLLSYYRKVEQFHQQGAASHKRAVRKCHCGKRLSATSADVRAARCVVTCMHTRSYLASNTFT